MKDIVGKRIRDLRKIAGVTQEELRIALDYKSTGMISQVENGLKGMSTEQLIECAKVLGVHPAVLISDIELNYEDLEMLHQLTKVVRDKGLHYNAIKLLLKDS